MTLYARLEKPERWELWKDGSPKQARVLCGKRGPDGAQCCPGPLAYFLFPRPERRVGPFSYDPTPPRLILSGMRPDADGVWRATVDALRAYKRVGVLTEFNTEERTAHLKRHIRQFNELDEKRWVELLPPPAQSPRAACPRCGLEQDLLDAEDLDILKSAMQ